ncbi:hypothetical protein M408DRAFT_63120 [Serendipita vermifera MAFF 305830]|uniref:NAD(P)-binding domain-containing protein n=1 Tax=Serendipita vermifera MAFF 305830 TaxID=933852 RepID=A0A0C3BK07_SERVB|nr:hypothetical protein M408DRAFT_63120 [Serendipita vermifera MAFF 305830]
MALNILVLGGTGPTGLALINESITRKHHVIIFARSPQKIPQEISSHPSVVIVTGSLEDEEAIERAFTDPTYIKIDAVISALGPPVMGIHPSGHPIAKGYARVARIGKEYGVSRFIVLGTASITDELDHFDARFKALVLGVQTFAPHAYEDMVQIGKLFNILNDTDWTIARVPVLIQHKENEGPYHAGYIYIGDGHTTTWLSRPRFANFVLDEVETPKWIRKRPLISMS